MLKHLQDRFDQPSPYVPSVDTPWEDKEEAEARVQVRFGDRSTHRAYHTIYEDMLL